MLWVILWVFLHLRSKKLLCDLYLLPLDPEDLLDANCEIFQFWVCIIHSWKCIFSSISWAVVWSFSSLPLARLLWHLTPWRQHLWESYLLWRASLWMRHTFKFQWKWRGLCLFVCLPIYFVVFVWYVEKRGKLLCVSAIFRLKVLGLSFPLYGFVLLNLLQIYLQHLWSKLIL